MFKVCERIQRNGITCIILKMQYKNCERQGKQQDLYGAEKGITTDKPKCLRSVEDGGEHCSCLQATQVEGVGQWRRGWGHDTGQHWGPQSLGSGVSLIGHVI